jgi:hypothetical protein
MAVEFVVYQVALRQVFLRTIWFSSVSIIPPKPHNNNNNNNNNLSKGKERKARKPFNKAIFFRNREHGGKNTFFLSELK